MTNKTLPDGWQWKKLGEIVSLLGDGLHGTPLYVDNSEYYFINGNNLENGAIIIKENTKKVSLQEYEKYKKKLNKESSVLVSINGTLGNIAFYNDEKVILGKSACYFNLLDCANKYYIRYILSSKNFINYINKESTGSTIKNVSLKSMREFPIPLPPLEEQKRIVAKIDAAFEQLDEAISLQKNNILRTEILKKALLVEQFSELPYEKKELGEISKLGTGATPLTSNKTYYENGNVVWITSSSTNEPFVKTPEKFITEKALKETNCKTYPVGTLIIALYGQGKTRGQITELCIEAATNQACAAIVLNDKSLSHRKYIKYFFLMSYTKLREMSSGGTQENLNLNKIKTTKIPLPPIVEQEKIVACLDKSFAEIDKMLEAQKKRLAHLEGMKKAILQEAFEGKL